LHPDNTALIRTLPTLVQRTFLQLLWLESTLFKNYPGYYFPTLQEIPPVKDINEHVLERIKHQIERYLNKICARGNVLILFKEVLQFLDAQATVPSAPATKPGEPFRMFDYLGKVNYERGIRIYVPTIALPEQDHDEFQRRQTYVLMLETYYNALSAACNRLFSHQKRNNPICIILIQICIRALIKYHKGIWK
jgi:hypothetical protein